MRWFSSLLDIIGEIGDGSEGVARLGVSSSSGCTNGNAGMTSDDAVSCLYG